MNIHYQPVPTKLHIGTLQRRTRLLRQGIIVNPWPEDHSLVGRFMAKIFYAGDCIAWIGAIDRHGYGVFSVNGKAQRAHRIAYELQYGEIPGGLHLDHLCRNPICVNPAHLEPVTREENTARGHFFAFSKARGQTPSCKYGHLYTEANLKRAKGNGQRVCKTCQRERSARRRAVAHANRQ